VKENGFTVAVPNFSSGQNTAGDTGWGGVTLWEAERSLILSTLEKMAGNRTHAAKSLGISIRTLRNKLREYRGSDASEEWAEEEKEEGKVLPVA
jgi:DNA-binding NtrC family response regulator